MPYAGGSDVGLVRPRNEDAYLLEPPLFAVADGLGGHQAGEIASRVAMETLLGEAPSRPDPKALARAVRAANAAVMQAAEEGRGRAGMGTTLTAAMVEGTRIVIAHVGDSRAYLLEGGTLTQLTQDHSIVADMVRSGAITPETARVHPSRSVITRALGSDPNLAVDVLEVVARPGARLLLCTDGLSGMLTDDEIARILAAEPSADEAVRRLITAANDAGGQDNITVVVVELGHADLTFERLAGRGASSHETAPSGPGGRRAWLARVMWLAGALIIVGSALWMACSYARSRAYVTEVDGRVAIFRGVPGQMAGVRMSWLETVSPVPVTSLGPVTAARLKAGIVVKDLPTAYAMLERLAVEGGEPSTPTTPPVP